MQRSVRNFKFTDASLRQLSTPGYAYDQFLPGFGVYVGKSVKTFLYIKDGKRTAIGRMNHISLQDARNHARIHLSAVPIAAQTPKLSVAFEEYIRSLQRRPRTVHEYDRLVRTHFLPKLGAQPLSELTAREIIAITDKLLHKPTECRHAHAALKTFLRWCVPRYINTSPMSDLRLPTQPKTRSRVLTPDELRRVWTASKQLGDFGIVVRLCILTGQRRGELSSLTSQHFNDTLLSFPTTLTKNKREHSIPLTKHSLKHLSSLTTPVRAWSKPKVKLDQLSGVSGWTLHDLRRTLATLLASLAVPPHVIERLLNHSTGSISAIGAIYNRHHFLPEMRQALERYEEHLTSIGIDLAS